MEPPSLQTSRLSVIGTSLNASPTLVFGLRVPASSFASQVSVLGERIALPGRQHLLRFGFHDQQDCFLVGAGHREAEKVERVMQRQHMALSARTGLTCAVLVAPHESHESDQPAAVSVEVELEGFSDGGVPAPSRRLRSVVVCHGP